MTATLSGFFLARSSRITARFRLISVLHLHRREGLDYPALGKHPASGWRRHPGGRGGRRSSRHLACQHLAREAHQADHIVAVRVAHEARLPVLVDADGAVADGEGPAVDKGVTAHDAIARILLARVGGPHLVEDEVAVGVGDELALVDLDPLDGVWVIADDKVRTRVDSQATDLFWIVGGDAVICALRIEHVLLAPVELHHGHVGATAGVSDLALHLSSIDSASNAVKAEKGKAHTFD